MRNLATIILFVLSLTACATTENPTVTTARNICAIAYGDPALDPIRNRIPIGDDQAAKASMDHLADRGKPNAAERAALKQYDAANRRCWDAWDKAGTSPFIQQARTTVSTALAELYGGAATYADFNRKRAAAIAEMQSRLKESEERDRAANLSRNSGIMLCNGWGNGPFFMSHCF